jgi:hypothetical protein
MSQRSVSLLQPTEGCAKEKLGIPGGTPEKAVDKGEGGGVDRGCMKKELIRQVRSLYRAPFPLEILVLKIVCRRSG